MTKISIYYLYQYQTLLGCTNAEFKSTNAKEFVSKCFLDVSYEAKWFLSQYAKIVRYRILISYLFPEVLVANNRSLTRRSRRLKSAEGENLLIAKKCREDKRSANHEKLGDVLA